MLTSKTAFKLSLIATFFIRFMGCSVQANCSKLTIVYIYVILYKSIDLHFAKSYFSIKIQRWLVSPLKELRDSNKHLHISYIENFGD